MQFCIIRDDKELVAALKQAHFAFDSIYLDGPPAEVLTVYQAYKKRTQNKNRRSNSRHVTVQSTDAESATAASQPTMINQRLLNLGMGPVMRNVMGDITINTNVKCRNIDDEEVHKSIEEQVTGHDMLEDVDTTELTNNDHLFGYVHDDVYDPESMEMDGWSFN